MKITYYDIGLNLFCRQFPDPEKVIRDAKEAGVCCILTGTDRRENQMIHEFVAEHNVYGTAGIHPHNADSAKKEDFELIEQLAVNNPKIVAIGECGLLTGCFLPGKTRSGAWKSILCWQSGLESLCFFMRGLQRMNL